MAFATIEDIQGLIDLVIFPNTWKKYGELVRFDEIIYVRGKADANGGDAKVLVDQVSNNVTQLEPLQKTKQAASPPIEDLPAPEPYSPFTHKANF